MRRLDRVHRSLFKTAPTVQEARLSWSLSEGASLQNEAIASPCGLAPTGMEQVKVGALS
jgi:hypothetical protein